MEVPCTTKPAPGRVVYPVGRAALSPLSRGWAPKQPLSAPPAGSNVGLQEQLAAPVHVRRREGAHVPGDAGGGPRDPLDPWGPGAPWGGVM